MESFSPKIIYRLIYFRVQECKNFHLRDIIFYAESIFWFKKNSNKSIILCICRKVINLSMTTDLEVILHKFYCFCFSFIYQSERSKSPKFQKNLFGNLRHMKKHSFVTSKNPSQKAFSVPRLEKYYSWILTASKFRKWRQYFHRQYESYKTASHQLNFLIMLQTVEMLKDPQNLGMKSVQEDDPVSAT